MKKTIEYNRRGTRTIPVNRFSGGFIEHFLNRLEEYNWSISDFKPNDFVFYLQTLVPIEHYGEAPICIELTYHPTLKTLTAARILMPIPIIEYAIEFKLPYGQWLLKLDKFFTLDINELKKEN